MSAQDPAEIDQTTDFMWKATAAVATLASGFVAEKVVDHYKAFDKLPHGAFSYKFI